MKVLQTVVRDGNPIAHDFSALAAIQPSLVLVFGSVATLQAGASAIARAFPANVTAGNTLVAAFAWGAHALGTKKSTTIRSG